MRKITVSLCWIAFLLLTVSSCKMIREEKQAYQISNTDDNEFDPICGDSIIWHIHLQEGFNNDTVQFVIDRDTFPSQVFPNSELIAMSGHNGCTGIYLTCYKKEGETKIFLKNMPKFNSVREFTNGDYENLSVKILINNMPINFQTSLTYNRFFGLNYHSEEHFITALKGKSCFECR